MSFPTTDRLKILTEAFSTQAQTPWGSHPFSPGTLLGLVVDFLALGQSASDNQGWCLEVMPLPLTSVTQQGDPTFNVSVPSSTSNVITYRVYPVNVPATSVKSAYTKGDTIAYFPFWAGGDNAEKVRGTYVTIQAFTPLIPVHVTMDGGSAGSAAVLSPGGSGTVIQAASACSFTYTVTNLTGDPIGDGQQPSSSKKSPLWNTASFRLPGVIYSPAGSGDICLAYRDVKGLTLLYVTETPQAGDCSASTTSTTSSTASSTSGGS